MKTVYLFIKLTSYFILCFAVFPLFVVWACVKTSVFKIKFKGGLRRFGMPPHEARSLAKELSAKNYLKEK